MADLQEFASVLQATVTAPRLSGSKVQTLTSLALKLADQVPSQDTPLVTSFYKINASLPAASTSRISSLYVFDAIARAARTAATGGGKDGKGKGKESAGALGLVTKLEGVVESWVTGMLEDGKGGLWAEGKEKVRKILEIWAKSQTFPQSTLDRLTAKLQARAATRPPAKTNGSSSDLLDSSYAVPDGPEQAQTSASVTVPQPPASMFSPTSAPKISSTGSEQGQGLAAPLQSPSTFTPPATASPAQPGLPPEILKLLGLSAQTASPTTSTSTPLPQTGPAPFGDPRLAKATPFPSYAAPAPLAAPAAVPAVPALPGLDLAAILASVKPVVTTPPAAAAPAHSPIPPYAPAPVATDPRLAARPSPQQQTGPAPGQAYPPPFPSHRQHSQPPPFMPGPHGVPPPLPPPQAQAQPQGQSANMGQNLKPDQLRLLASFAQPPPPLPSAGPNGASAPFSPPPSHAAGGHGWRDSRDFDPVQRGGRPRSRSPGPRRSDGPLPPAQRAWNHGAHDQQQRRESWQDGDGAQRGRGGQRGGRGGYAGDRGDWRGGGGGGGSGAGWSGPGPEAGGPGGGRAPTPDRPPQQGRAPLPAAPPGKDEFGRDLPASAAAAAGKPADGVDGEEDMALDDSDDEGKGSGRNGPAQQTQQHPQHQFQQNQQQQQPFTRPQGQFPPPPQTNHSNRFGGPPPGAGSGPTLQTFDLSTFNPMMPEAWIALGQAWKNSTGREANQMDLMAFLASGGTNVPPS